MIETKIVRRHGETQHLYKGKELLENTIKAVNNRIEALKEELLRADTMPQVREIQQKVKDLRELLNTYDIIMKSYGGK